MPLICSLQVNHEREKAIERSVRQIERLQLQMQEIRNNMRLNGRKSEAQRQLLEQEKSTVQVQVTELREKMRTFQADQRSRRTHLAQRSDAAIMTLKEKCDLARRILALGDLTRKPLRFWTMKL